MTLRTRLALSLVALFAVGLVVYGVATTRSFARSELARLDADLERAGPLVLRQLAAGAGFGGDVMPLGGGPVPEGGGRGRGGPPVVVAPGTYAELRGPAGTTVATLQVAEDAGRPDLTGISPDAGGPFTVPGTDGGAAWRVSAQQVMAGAQLLVAVPLSGVEARIDRLVRTELVAGVALLLLLAGGSWALVRRELRPIEDMAVTAGSITAGNLDRRVVGSDPTTEVGQLATALNGMLDELERSFAEREATEARLRRFLADASHELRTPLTSIQGFAELFRLGAESEHVDLPTILRRIEEESERMRRLVEDLLLLARLDETSPLVRQPVDLAILAADACSDAVAADPGRRVTLHAPTPVPVVGDPHHLRQALANLVANALRHTPAGTPLEVAAEADGATAVLTVRDHGPGLDEQARAHAFDRFWRADAARSGTGVGLGLAIVAAIAREHAGEVSADNAHDGHGAVFTLRLPVATADMPADAPAAVPEGSA